MPFIVPLIPAIVAASSATVGGLEAAGTFSPSPSEALAKQQRAMAEGQQKSNQSMEQAMFKKFAPEAQAQTGGSLSDTSLSSMIAELSGAPADAGLAQKTIFGNTPGLSSTDLTGGQG